MHSESRLALFPDTTTILNNALHIAGQELAGLAEKFGTPLYVYDRATMDGAVSRYKAALKAHYAGSSFITYAGKAFLCTAFARWADQNGLWIDCTGEAEIGAAVAAHVPASGIVVHGVNKSVPDLDFAVRHAATLVVDNMDELHRLAVVLESGRGYRRSRTTLESIWLRLQPGFSVSTHHSHTQTGQSGSKFGISPAEMLQAAKEARAGGLPVDGIHFHLGSNFRETSPLIGAIDSALDLAKKIGLTEPWHFSPGGGWGVAYRDEELPGPDLEPYVRSIAETVAKRCRSNGLRLPILHIEPGRSLTARAGVAIYRLGTIKRRKDRTWLLVDGGMADNPRHALYGAEYSCLPAVGLGREFTELVSIGGPYCESGDVLTEDLMMPTLEVGELIVIPVSGAYQLSMASNYNGACRPAVVWLDGSRSHLIVRRETPADLYRRDVPLP
jgi:diaminopimelate decarboxylase